MEKKLKKALEILDEIMYEGEERELKKVLQEIENAICNVEDAIQKLEK